MTEAEKRRIAEHVKKEHETYSHRDPYGHIEDIIMLSRRDLDHLTRSRQEAIAKDIKRIYKALTLKN